MANETNLTMVGRLTADPALSFTKSGVAVAKFTIASSERTFDRNSGSWQDGRTLFMSCTAWRELAENIAESLHKGMLVLAVGSIVTNKFTGRDGQERTAIDMTVENIGPSLRWAHAKVEPVSRDGSRSNYGGGAGGGQGYGNQGGAGSQGGYSPAGGAPQGGQDSWANNGYGSAPNDSVFDDEAPF